MKNDFQIILLNKNSKFNLSFSLNKNIIFILIFFFIALIGFSTWGIFRIIKPHKTQELIKQNISLKHNTINLLSALIKNDTIDSTILNNYKINHNLSNLIPNNLPVEGIVTQGLENKKGHNGIDIAATLNSNVKPAQEGLVVFAGESFTQLPITTDYSAAKMILSTINTNTIFIMYAAHIIPNPIPIAKNAIVNLNKTGLPVFLYPIYENIPIIIPIRNPTRLKIFSNKSSNYKM